MTLGGLLREELAVTSELLVIDGLSLRDFDYIDIGRIRFPSNTVPVTIKSLIFHQDPGHDRPTSATPGRFPPDSDPGPPPGDRRSAAGGGP